MTDTPKWTTIAEKELREKPVSGRNEWVRFMKPNFHGVFACLCPKSKEFLKL